MLEYLKNPIPYKLDGNILVMEESEIRIEGINNFRGCSLQPKSPTMLIERGEILECRGGSESVLYIKLLKAGKTVEILFKEFDRIKTLQVGDCVRISTPTGDQIGNIEGISTGRDWITVGKLRGTLEHQEHPAGDSMYIGIDNILAIDRSFDKIFTNCKALRKGS